MGQRRDTRHVNVTATINNAIQEAQQLLRERVLRELRYQPGFCGDVTVTLRIRNGVPFGAKESIDNSVLIAPIQN